MNGTRQDRLVRTMRVEKIRDLESANWYLDEVFLPQHNGRFAAQPADATDAHVLVNLEELDRALCMWEQRVTGKDQCVSWEGLVLQLQPTKTMPSLSGKTVRPPLQPSSRLTSTRELSENVRKLTDATPKLSYTSATGYYLFFA